MSIYKIISSLNGAGRSVRITFSIGLRIKLTTILQFPSSSQKHLPRNSSTSIMTGMNQAFHLYRVQQIDTQIDQTESSLAAVDRLLAGDEAVRQARQNAEQAGKRLHQARQDLKQIEFAVQEQQIKISQSESTLYSGRVRNPKELQDLQKEIASLKKHLNTLEDQQIEAMLATEEAEAQDQTAADELNQTQATFAEQSAGWRGQREQLVRNLERLQAERAAALSLVTPENLAIYENLRKRKSGIAVSVAKEGSCSACGAGIRPSELQELRAAQNLSFCSTCGRILYAG